MKKGKISKFIIGAAMTLCLGVAPLTSCSTFFGEDGFAIKDITWVLDENSGNVVVTIKTTNDENPTMIFTIPQGIAGVDGVGIKDITSTSKVVDGVTEVTVTIKYTDANISPTILTFPVENGKDGKGVEAVDVKNDENGNIVIQFTYTDGTKSQEITIPKGIDGVDGVGIKDVTIDDSDANVVKVTITFTDDEMPAKVIELPKGVGIRSVTYDPDQSSDDVYALVVEYTDGFIDVVELPRPKSIEWHTGSSSPETNLGKDGDFYLNTASGFVYKKAGNEWMFLFSMKGTGSAVEFIVSFHPNGGVWTNPQLKDNVVYNVPVKYGEYINLDRFPGIAYEGYNFNGWWTSADANPNAGHFTDLTPVLRNMDVYANWIAK